MNVDKMPSGLEMDKLVAQKVMGLSVAQKVMGLSVVDDPVNRRGVSVGEAGPRGADLKAYSTDIAAAWEVVERILEIEKSKGTYLPVFLVEAAPDGCSAVLQVGMGFEKAVKNAETAPLAICGAALKVYFIGGESR